MKNFSAVIVLLALVGAVSLIGHAEEEAPDLSSTKMSDSQSDSFWGSNYGIMIGMQKPTFSSELKYYDVFYGKTAWQPSLYLNDFLFTTSFLQLGWGFNLSAYTDTGHQKEATSAGLPTAGSDFVNSGTNLSLTLLSYRFSLIGKVKIPNFKYFDVNIWTGYQETGYQEVLDLGIDSSSTARATTTTNSKAQPTIYYGWENELALGASFNVLLNFLEEQSVLALKRSTGFERVYLSPYLEVISKISNRAIAGKSPKDLTLARQSFGIAFNFE